MRRLLFYVGLILPAVTLITAPVSANSSAALTGSIKVDGSSTVYPVTEAVAEEFQAKFPKTRVTVGLSGTGGGMKKFTTGETDISTASRPMKASEMKVAQQNKIDYIQLSVAYDGISIVVSRNSPLQSISSAELKTLWEPESKINKWSDLRKDLPDSDIKLYGPGPDSGTFDYFTEEIVGKARASRPDYTASEDDNVLVRGLVNDPGALGYFGYSYFVENADKLRALPVDGVTPSMDSIRSGKYQPLARPLFLYVSSKAVAKPQVIKFVKFYLKNAPDLSRQVGYTPLPESEYRQQIAAFDAFVKKHDQSGQQAE